MKDRLHRLRQKSAECRQNMPRWFIVLTIVLSLVVAPAAGQSISDGEWSDDFSDGDADGWGLYPESAWEVVNASADGTGQSLHGVTDAETETVARWEEAPRLDTSDEFVVEGTVKPQFNEDSPVIRFGVASDDTAAEGQNAFILMSYDGQTWFGSSENADPTSEALGTNFDGEWVNFRIESGGDGNLTAKIWRVGNPEPTNPQFNRSGFEGATGEFGVVIGNVDQREFWIDEVNISGSRATNPRLELDTKNYMKHGTSQPYRVLWEENTTGIANETANVTDNATVESLNTSVITVDETTHELIATNNTAVDQRVSVRATYNGSTTYKNITVATADVENLEILPPMWRFSASIGSPTIQAILVAVFMGVFAGRLAGAFAGLGMMQLVMVAGWFAGYASVGIAMISLFVALFIGLNMAANIDYTVSRG